MIAWYRASQFALRRESPVASARAIEWDTSGPPVDGRPFDSHRCPLRRRAVRAHPAEQQGVDGRVANAFHTVPSHGRVAPVTTVPMEPADVNWCNVLAHHARRTPDKVFTLFENEAITYGEMATRVAALAGGLAGRGVGPGDVVAILSYNCPEFLEALFAANHVGAIAMPINWRLAAPEVRYILEHSGARALVCDATLLPLAEQAAAGLDDGSDGGGGLLRVSIAPAGRPGWVSMADL